MPRNRTRFCVSVDGRPRELFAVTEDNSGRLTLTIRSAGHLADGSVRIPTEFHKISVHPNPKSERFNTVHLTWKLTNGEVIERHLLTDAVKKRTGFAHIYIRRCPHLGQEALAPSDEGRPTTKLIIVDDHDPERFIFIHSILIGSPNNEFPSFPGMLPRVTQYAFKNFRVIVLSAQIILRSIRSGAFIYLFTMAHEELRGEWTRRIVGELMQGRAPDECAIEFRVGASELVLVVLESSRQKMFQEMNSEDRKLLRYSIRRLRREVRMLSKRMRPGLVTLILDRDYSPPSF